MSWVLPDDKLYPEFPQAYDGQPLIRAGSAQSLLTGVTRFSTGEFDPFNLQTLVIGDSIVDCHGRPNSDVIFWYEGQVSNPWDHFSSHSGFFKAELDGWVASSV